VTCYVFSMAENDNGTLSKLRTRVTDGVMDVALFFIIPPTALVFRISEKIKDRAKA
jgi:hypothetical protein